MRTLRSRLREHQHLGVRKDREADIRWQPILRQPHTRKTETEMEERRDKEYIIEVTADKEQQQQAILLIAKATGIETERIEQCITELERYGILTEDRSLYMDTRGCIQEDIRGYYCPGKLEDKGYYCTTYIEQEILEEKRQNKLRRFHASRKPLPRTAPKAKTWSWNRIRSRPNTKHGYH